MKMKEWLLKQIIDKLFLSLIAGLFLAFAVFLMDRDNARQSEASMANDARIEVTTQLFLRLSDAIIKTIDILRDDQRGLFEDITDRRKRESTVINLISEQGSIVIAMNTAFENDKTLNDWVAECASIFETELLSTELPIEDSTVSNKVIARLGNCHSNAALSLSERLRQEILTNNNAKNNYRNLPGWFALITFLVVVFSCFTWILVSLNGQISDRS